MNALSGLAILLVLQTGGELLARAFGLPFPGPVIGLVLLLAALRLRFVQTRVAVVAEFLLAHLSLLFVPVGVGVMTHLGLLGRYGWRLAVTALCLRTMLRSRGDADAKAGGEAVAAIEAERSR